MSSAIQSAIQSATVWAAGPAATAAAEPAAPPPAASVAASVAASSSYTLVCSTCEQPRTIAAVDLPQAQRQLLADGWRRDDRRDGLRDELRDEHGDEDLGQLTCPTCAMASMPRLSAAEWVAAHPEAHGQLLVRGSTPDQITARARMAIAAHWPPCGDVVLNTVRTGCWRTERCRCHSLPGRAAHPAWHYTSASADDPTAFTAAEIRLYNSSRLPAAVTAERRQS